MCKIILINYLFSYNNRGGFKSIDIYKYLFFFYICKNEIDSVVF